MNELGQDYDSTLEELWRRIRKSPIPMSERAESVWRLVAQKRENVEISESLLGGDVKKVERQLVALYQKCGIDEAGPQNARLKRRMLEDLGVRYFDLRRGTDASSQPTGTNRLGAQDLGGATDTLLTDLSEFAEDLTEVRESMDLRRYLAEEEAMPGLLANFFRNIDPEARPDFPPAIAVWSYQARVTMMMWLLSRDSAPPVRALATSILLTTIEPFIDTLEDLGGWGHGWYAVFSIACAQAILEAADEEWDAALIHRIPVVSSLTKHAATARDHLRTAQAFNELSYYDQAFQDCVKDMFGEDSPLRESQTFLEHLQDLEGQLEKAFPLPPITPT